MNKELSPLEALKNIEERIYGKIPEGSGVVDSDLYIIETALKDYEKKLKALEIIKEKGIDILEFRATKKSENL